MYIKQSRTFIAMFVFLVFAVAIIGVLYIFGVISPAEFKDYTLRTSATALVVLIASLLVSGALSLNKRQ